MQIVMFSKHLGGLPLPEAGRRIRELGFQGVDLTVRPGGHVLPERVERDLPVAVRQLADLGLAVPMITTGITGTSDPHAEATAATAARLGIRELKLGYWPYRDPGTLRGQLDAARGAMDGLEALARKHGVRVSIHTHSGAYLSASAGNLYLILHGRDPHHAGAYVDPGHLTLEGFDQGWKLGLDLLQGYLSMVAVKTFGIFQEPAEPGGPARWRHRLVPLRDGIARWADVFATLKKLGWDGILTFHSEYQGAHSWRDLTLEELLIQTREDLAYLRPILRESGYPA